MAISKKFLRIIEKAIEADDKSPIEDELNRLSAKNYKTGITTAYSVVKNVPDKWKEHFKPSNEQLDVYTEKVDADAKPKKQLKVSMRMIENIINDRENSTDARLAYVLLNTGRRMSEILENEFEVKGGKLYIVINKKSDKELGKIHILLDGDPKRAVEDIKKIRNSIEDDKMNTVRKGFQNYVARTYQLTPHKLRSIYARYAYLFRNPEKYSNGWFINHVLNHSLDSGSATNYDSVVFDNNEKDIFRETLNKKPKKELSDNLKGSGRVVSSKLTKNKLLDMMLL